MFQRSTQGGVCCQPVVAPAVGLSLSTDLGCTWIPGGPEQFSAQGGKPMRTVACAIIGNPEGLSPANSSDEVEEWRRGET